MFTSAKKKLLTKIQNNNNTMSHWHGNCAEDEDDELRRLANEAEAANLIIAENLSKKLRNDKELFVALLLYTPETFLYASEDLKNDKEFIFNYLRENDWAYPMIKHVSKALRNDKKFIFDLLEIDGSCIEFFNDEFKNDKDIIIAAIKNNSRAIHCLDTQTLDDKSIMLELVRLDSELFCYSSDRLQKDEELRRLANQKDAADEENESLDMDTNPPSEKILEPISEVETDEEDSLDSIEESSEVDLYSKSSIEDERISDMNKIKALEEDKVLERKITIASRIFIIVGIPGGLYLIDKNPYIGSAFLCLAAFGIVWHWSIS
ncbi:DUF4116 domain-containing protein [Sulfurimonas sp.]|nr:DUF4116 domain-containing protein [Sulfurimonas sp.]